MAYVNENVAVDQVGSAGMPDLSLDLAEKSVYTQHEPLARPEGSSGSIAAGEGTLPQLGYEAKICRPDGRLLRSLRMVARYMDVAA